MLFNSWGYVAFLILGVGTHWLLPHRWRLHLLGAMSVLFYALWRWEFVILVVGSALVDFVAARRIYVAESRAAARSWLIASLTINLGLLGIFKYTYFFYDNVRLVGAQMGADLPALSDLGVRLILPLGISFYTFQSISYTIDAYRRLIRPTTDFFAFFTFVAYWPQLIAGPILRATEVIPQLTSRRTWRRGDFTVGVGLVVSGLFKKVVLADNIAPVVDTAFNLPPAYMTAFDVWAAAILFGFQIYFDFSGYSDVAIGSARLCGIRFPANFDWPYLARTPREFWRRWHISLSSWIRDYLYLPLAGERFRGGSAGGIGVAAETRGRSRALFLTWAIMGLWHGAAWTFVLWGVYHAALIFVYRVVTPLRRIERLPIAGWALTFAAAMAGWIPFRAHSVEQALAMFAAILDPRRYHLANRGLQTDHYLAALLLTAAMVAARPLRDWIAGFEPAGVPRLVTVGVGLSLLVSLAVAYLRAVDQFIYFQF